MKKKILITGSNGFIGSFLVEEALTRNYEVYAGVRNSSNIQYLTDKNINFFELDFSDPAALLKKITDAPAFDFVIHNAGLTKANNKEDYFTVNYRYTQNLVDALIQSNKIPEKFIYMSSLAAYGPGDGESLKNVELKDTPNPITSYGKSKLESEKYIYKQNNFPYLIFRPTAVYGPREKDLLVFIKLINKNFELYIGRKRQYLTFIHVKDLVKAVFQGIETNIINKSYFVSDGNVYNGKMFGLIIKRHLGKKTLQISVPTSIVRSIAFVLEFIYSFAGKIPLLNSEKIKELESTNWKCEVKPLQDDLNFKSEYDLKSGVYETIGWYKNANWI